MYCSNCGAEIKDGQVYCSSCGAKQEESVENTTVEVVNTVENVNNQDKPQAKCWSIFAKVGFGLGLGSLIGFWIFYLSIFTAEIGLVFSILGKRSNTNGSRAKTGIILSSIALGLSLVIWIVLLSMAMDSLSDYSDGYYYY